MSAATTIAPAPSPERLAIVLPTWVGDTVMATPVLHALRGWFPDARLRLVGRPSLEPMLEGLAGIESFIADDLAQPWRGGRALRSSFGPDMVLLLRNSFRSALFARATGAKRRIGTARDARRFLLTDAIDLTRADQPRSTLLDYVELAERAFGRAIDDRRPRLATSASDESEADGLLDGVASRFALLNPGASKEAKRWPAQRWVELADRLARTRGLDVVVSGAPDEAEMLASIVAGAEARGTTVVDLAARGVRLGGLKAVLRRASVVVTNDTGPRHVAAALGTPTVVLFGPTDHRFTLLPGVPDRLVLAEPFLTEDRVADDFPKACRIDRIETGDVVHAVDSLLSCVS